MNFYATDIFQNVLVCFLKPVKIIFSIVIETLCKHIL
jgi:hypothetical protein